MELKEKYKNTCDKQYVMSLNELFETWIRLELKLELNFSRALAQLPGGCGAKIFGFPPSFYNCDNTLGSLKFQFNQLEPTKNS
jgi:hypothetical protein